MEVNLNTLEGENDHEHDWHFCRTDEDWFDGDETDVYKCAVEGCSEIDYRYIPR